MVINFLNYFQIEAGAKGNVSFLLGLDLLLANEAINRQHKTEQELAVDKIRSFEKTVEHALHEQTSDSGERNEAVA